MLSNASGAVWIRFFNITTSHLGHSYGTDSGKGQKKRRDDFCAFVNDTWFLLQVRDGKHKPKKIAFYESTQFAGLINMIDLGRAFSILLSGDR